MEVEIHVSEEELAEFPEEDNRFNRTTGTVW